MRAAPIGLRSPPLASKLTANTGRQRPFWHTACSRSNPQPPAPATLMPEPEPVLAISKSPGRNCNESLIQLWYYAMADHQAIPQNLKPSAPFHFTPDVSSSAAPGRPLCGKSCQCVMVGVLRTQRWSSFHRPDWPRPSDEDFVFYKRLDGDSTVIRDLPSFLEHSGYRLPKQLSAPSLRRASPLSSTCPVVLNGPQIKPPPLPPPRVVFKTV